MICCSYQIFVRPHACSANFTYYGGLFISSYPWELAVVSLRRPPKSMSELTFFYFPQSCLLSRITVAGGSLSTLSSRSWIRDELVKHQIRSVTAQIQIKPFFSFFRDLLFYVIIQFKKNPYHNFFLCDLYKIEEKNMKFKTVCDIWLRVFSLFSVFIRLWWTMI